MPKLSTKHQNQQTVTLGGFTGGLNTSVSEEFIQPAQLAEAVNVECDNVSGCLRTVLGTKDLINIDDESSLFACAWDRINNRLILFSRTGDIYATDTLITECKKIGTLSVEPTEDTEISTCNWENGIIIACGGTLQYARYLDDEYEVIELEQAPTECRCVFVRSGRICTFGYKETEDESEDTLYYSSVGDEETWEYDSNDPSMALFQQIGYKTGGKLKAACNLVNDILLIKDNGMCYRLENEYPDWVLHEVSREMFVKNVNSAVSTGGGQALILAPDWLQQVTPTQDYGDMRPQRVGEQVRIQLKSLPYVTKVRYLATLDQIWFITESRDVLVFDCASQAFFQRRFNSDVVDAVAVVDRVIVVKKGKVCILDNNCESLLDDGEELEYKARFHTEIFSHDVLVKASSISITPLTTSYDNAQATLTVGRINIPFPKRKSSTDGRMKQTVGLTQTALEPAEQDATIAGHSVHLKVRQIFRGDRVRVYLSGKGFPFILNFITYDKVEV